MVVIIRNSCFENRALYLPTSVLMCFYDYRNKPRLFPSTVVHGWYFYRRRRAFPVQRNQTLMHYSAEIRASNHTCDYYVYVLKSFHAKWWTLSLDSSKNTAGNYVLLVLQCKFPVVCTKTNTVHKAVTTHLLYYTILIRVVHICILFFLYLYIYLRFI